MPQTTISDVNSIDVVNTILTFITGGLATFIAYLLLKLQRQQQEEAWIKAYTEIHQLFWTDPAMARVRCWIQYDSAYLEIRPILEKRQRISKPGSQEVLLEPEYRCLDDLDRFYNLMLEVRALTQRLEEKPKPILKRRWFGEPNRASKPQDATELDLNRFWEGFYFDYWVSGRISKQEDRRELEWYVNKFYKELLDLQQDVGQRDSSFQKTRSKSEPTHD